MRRLVLSALLLASAFQTALGEQSGDWTYSVENNRATITGYTGAGATVTIPGTLGGFTVTKIQNWAFNYKTSITSITMPDSVVSIGSSAFRACYNLTSITISGQVTNIGPWTFEGCAKLSSITIPNSVTSIGENAFYDCFSLTTLTMGSGVNTIGDSAFRFCTSLSSVTMGSGVTTIGDLAFNGCSGLTSVTIGSGVTSIGGGAFSGCGGLTSITIPNSVTSIGGNAFGGCSGLTSVTIGSGVTNIGSIAFSGCSGLISVIIGSGVTNIGSSAFSGCGGLTSITIPNSVTSIGENAFYDCNGLISVTMPDRFIGQVAQIGIHGKVATDYLVNALANNDAFVTAVANKIKATGGTYGIATQSGLSTAIEPLATKSELTSSLTQSRTDGINSVLSNPNLWTLYTTSQIQNMAVGDLVLTKNVAGTFTLNYDIEQSADLQTWTTYAPLSLPLTGLPTDKAFVRIKAKQ